MISYQPPIFRNKAVLGWVPLLTSQPFGARLCDILSFTRNYQQHQTNISWLILNPAHGKRLETDRMK